ncbi:MAG: lytic transglycosylase domain-containing protein [Thermovirgaceae bacterium]|nr:lytic transglycosylase domain-containing protein [Thermovirgaceae bacterium]
MARSSLNSAFLPALAIFLAFVLPLSFEVREIRAEGERYERLDLPGPEVKPEKMEGEVSSAKVQVIVSAFIRVNRSLDKATATSYAGHVIEAADRFGINPFMVASIIIRESTVKQNAHSRYAYGLMQINWKAHRKGLKSAFNHIQTLDDLLQPRNNILAGTWIFSWYLKSSGGNTEKALAKYLGRTGRKYIKRVLVGYHEMLRNFEKIEKRTETTLGGSTILVAVAVE